VKAVKAVIDAQSRVRVAARAWQPLAAADELTSVFDTLGLIRKALELDPARPKEPRRIQSFGKSPWYAHDRGCLP
jgi:hypothetical protein